MKRWLTQDPLADSLQFGEISNNEYSAVALNTYRFVKNDPISLIDPNGLNTQSSAPERDKGSTNDSAKEGERTPPCEDDQCKAGCKLKLRACLSVVGTGTLGCNYLMQIGCGVSCTGSGPAYIACLFLCNASARFGCGVTGALVGGLCRESYKTCLDDCGNS